MLYDAGAASYGGQLHAIDCKQSWRALAPARQTSEKAFEPASRASFHMWLQEIFSRSCVGSLVIVGCPPTLIPSRPRVQSSVPDDLANGCVRRALSEIKMFATSKVLQVSHVIAAKVLTGKAIVTASVFAGTVATGYVVQSGVPPAYVDGAAVLVNDAALTESPEMAAALADAQARRQEAAMAALDAAIDPAIPHLTVAAHRMTRQQQARYDAGNKPSTRLAEK